MIYKLSLFGCSKMEYWVLRKPSVHPPFRASFLFSPTNQRIIQASVQWHIPYVRFPTKAR